MKLSEIGAEGLISRIVQKRHLPSSAPGLVAGIGGDAAVISPESAGMLTLVTTDMLTERTDYLPHQITPYQLGWKSAAANISDIAAMGGLPTWTFASIGFRPETDVEYIDELYRGIVECGNCFGSILAGGDTNSVLGDAVISITQLGRVEQNNLARRSGARPGDRILVTGCLGDSLGGLYLLLRLGLAEALSASKNLIEAHFLPMPRIPEARAAVGTGFIRAMMDLSDGLAADLPKLCRASGVGAVVYAERLPISNHLCTGAERLGISAAELAEGGGEDYELLMAVAPEGVPSVTQAIEETGTRVTDIGEILPGGIAIELAGGERRPLKGGWEHFAGEQS
ncbi:MAG TPA: thiamine-phosphate kinase [Armatimonadetes bacterium]|nr:thiamine-phosphate kinase [Armatimonadota bacterium]